MKVIALDTSNEAIKQGLSEDPKIKCDLISLNSYGKERLRFLVSEIMRGYGKEEYGEDVAASVLELAFNAIKANYMHMNAVDIMSSNLHDKHEHITKRDLFTDRIVMKTYTGLLRTEQLANRVKDTIRKEGRVLKIREKAMNEERELTDEEKRLIEQNEEIMHRARSENFKITLVVARNENTVTFDIINDAPILPEGLARIASKRKLFKKYYDEDRVADFYMENLDETESAGFGSAMIDSRLLEMGYEDPMKHFTVLNLNNKTCASLTLTF